VDQQLEDVTGRALMHRRALLALLALGGSFGVCPSAGANAARSEAFKQGRGERGHVEGQHVRLDAQDAGGEPERLPEMAAATVRRHADIVLVRGAGALAAAKEAHDAHIARPPRRSCDRVTAPA
jgi:hypothetical protein